MQCPTVMSPANRQDLDDRLDRVDELAEERDRVAVGEILDAWGRRSFGPLFLLPGFVMITPGAGDIPGVTILMGMVITLAAVEFLLGLDHVWLPQWLLNLRVSTSKMQTATEWLHPVASFLDRWTKPRMTQFVHRVWRVLIGLSCLAIGLASPFMELVPFSAVVGGTAVVAAGLALTAHDGVLALGAIFSAAGAGALLAWLLV